MFKWLKRTFLKMFRELVVYHHSSLEFRAKLITLMISSDGTVNECEKELVKEIASETYTEDKDRAILLYDTVMEYHQKIATDNGLNFEDLIRIVDKEVKEVKRFCKKIELDKLERFTVCTEDEEERIFQRRILEFLRDLKHSCEV